MTLQLPHRNVGVNVNGRVHPLAPHERRALESIDDPATARQVMAEMIHASRRAQENIDRIAMEFPIQPHNLHNDVIVVENEGEPGDAVILGEDGKPKWGEVEASGDGGALLVPEKLEVIKITAAKGSGTSGGRLVFPTFNPSAIFAFTVGNGYNVAVPLATIKVKNLALVGSEQITGGKRPACRLFSPAGTGTPFAFGANPVPVTWTRAAEVNNKADTYIYLILMAASHVLSLSGSGLGNTEVEGVLKCTATQINEVRTEAQVCYYARDTANLCTAQSHGLIVQTVADWAEGSSGAAGIQIYYGSKSEREEGKAGPQFTFTFPNHLGSLEQRHVAVQRLHAE